VSLVSVRFVLSMEIVAVLARVDPVQSVVESSEQSVCVVVISGSCVFLKICEHYEISITEYLPCLLGVLKRGP
jgi:hypothetical protein